MLTNKIAAANSHFQRPFKQTCKVQCMVYINISIGQHLLIYFLNFVTFKSCKEKKHFCRLLQSTRDIEGSDLNVRPPVRLSFFHSVRHKTCTDQTTSQTLLAQFTPNWTSMICIKSSCAYSQHFTVHWFCHSYGPLTFFIF